MMKVIQGGFKKGFWLHDREAYSDEEIAKTNQRFRQLINRYPEYRSFFEFFLWDIKPKQKPRLVQ
ncbi:MAG: hypothetical protein C4567_01255 [Deltaproteobacteria bacterium]|nr:MAG: hypothetical protein C4567_01255 [Deltaproteobacteria bacterium]